MAGLGLQSAYGGAAMQDALRKRIADQIAAQLRQEQAQQQQFENTNTRRELALREKSALNIDQDRKDRLAETSKNNKISGALRILPLLKPGQSVNAPDAENINEAGLGSFLTAQPEQLPSTTIMGTGTQTLPETQNPAKAAGSVFTGTQADEVRTDERAFRAGEAEKTRGAAKERADADREVREMIARLSASGNAETRALANQLKQVQIDAASEKLTTAKETRGKSENSAREATKSALDTVNELLAHPGFGAATGAFDPRQIVETQPRIDFNAKRNRLVAALTLPNLGALKGPMSDKDIIFVKELATTLANGRMSAEATRAELERAKAFLQSKMAGEGAPAEPTNGITIKSIKQIN